MIYMIYTPNERSMAQKLVNQFPKAYQFVFAPSGIPAGSEQWKDSVLSAIKTSQVAIVLLTERAAEDETVRWRCEVCINEHISLFPVLISHYGENPNHLLSEITSEWQFVATLQLWFALTSIQDAEDKAGNSTAKESEITAANSIDNLLQKIDAEIMTTPMMDLHSAVSTFGMSITPLPGESWAPLIEAISSKVQIPIRCFISYSRKDTDFTVKLGADLRKAKIKTWRDAENIPAGVNWDREIEKAVKECSHLILIASPSSVQSENVMDEVSLAINKEKTVIPVVIETCELPMRIHRAQWVDFRESYDQGLKKLLEQLGVEVKSHD